MSDEGYRKVLEYWAEAVYGKPWEGSAVASFDMIFFAALDGWKMSWRHYEAWEEKMRAELGK